MPKQYLTLQVSDWITYLGNRESLSTNTWISLVALFIALVSLVLSSIRSINWVLTLTNIIVCFVIVLVMWKVITYYGKDAKRAKRLMDRIMEGDSDENKALKNAEDIRWAWLEDDKLP